MKPVGECFLKLVMAGGTTVYSLMSAAKILNQKKTASVTSYPSGWRNPSYKPL